MKSIVYIGKSKHSAWLNTADARNQVRVLKNNGYKDLSFDLVDHNYPDGHYFI